MAGAKADKDRVIFMSEEEASVPSKIVLESGEDDSPPGLILPSGEINWNCPCLGGMAVGPCGVEFREAFSCFHYSTADPKGSDCIEKFSEMQKCMLSYPELFEEKRGKFTDDEDDAEMAKKNDHEAAASNAEEEDKDKEVQTEEESSEKKEAAVGSSAESEPPTTEATVSSEVSAAAEKLDSVQLDASSSSSSDASGSSNSTDNS